MKAIRMSSSIRISFWFKHGRVNLTLVAVTACQRFRVALVTDGVSSRMQVEVPFSFFQILCLFQRYGNLTINWTRDRTDLDRNLRFCIHFLGYRSVKICRYDWPCKTTKYDVIFKLIGLSI